MRKHDEFDRLECGDGHLCEFGFESLIAPIVGGAINLMGADERTTEPYIDTTTEPWGPSVPAAERVLSEADRIYGAGGFAPIANELELLGRANQLAYAEQMLPGLLGATQASWMRGLDPGLDPYVGAMIQSAQNDLVLDYQRNVLPAIADRSQSVGGFGGSAQGVAKGIASEGLLKVLGDVETQLLSDAYKQSLGQQRAAWGAAPGMLGLGFMPSQTQQQTGAQYRADMMQPAQNLSGYQGTTLPYFQAGFGTTSAPSPYYQSPAQLAMGGAFAGQQLWNDIGASFNTGAAPITRSGAVMQSPATPTGGAQVYSIPLS